MNVEQFSNEFDTLFNSFARTIPFGTDESPMDVRIDEYEKSVFLTKAQKELVIAYYSGQNSYSLSFEEKEIVREALDTLVKTLTPEPLGDIPAAKHIIDDKRKMYFYRLPEDLLYIIFEEVKFSSYLSGCKGGNTAIVVPSTHDEVWHRMQNPFRGPSNRRVLRLNAENNLVELISDYPIGSYLLRYVEEPKPIILTDLPDGLTIDGISTKTECELPSILHHKILDVAVRMALQSKSVGLSGGQPSKS